MNTITVIVMAKDNALRTTDCPMSTAFRENTKQLVQKVGWGMYNFSDTVVIRASTYDGSDKELKPFVRRARKIAAAMGYEIGEFSPHQFVANDGKLHKHGTKFDAIMTRKAA